VKHPEEVLGGPFISDGYATKVLQPSVLVTCGAPAFVRSSHYFRLAEYPPSESDTANTCLIESGNPLTG
jgi:hypothetical protein